VSVGCGCGKDCNCQHEEAERANRLWYVLKMRGGLVEGVTLYLDGAMAFRAYDQLRGEALSDGKTVVDEDFLGPDAHFETSDGLSCFLGQAELVFP
jgi:hypothetical protein